jgi:translation initiation factor 2B subunit (eIF-2B alpha/beta/delta family)
MIDKISPNYYGGKDTPYEAIKVIHAHNLNFSLGNVVKYILRAGNKDPNTKIEDLKKARWYIEKEIEKCEKYNN